MAELLIKTRPGSSYEADDVLLCTNDRHIGHVHACHLCFPQFAVALPNGKQDARLKDMDGNGIMPSGHPSEVYGQTVRTLMFERVSQTEVIMRRLADGAEVRIESGVPFDNPFGGPPGQVMHVEEFFLRRRTAPLFPVHGTVGREIVYLGDHKLSDAPMGTLWDRLKTQHGHDRTDAKFKLFPWGEQDMKSHFAFTIPDTDDEFANEIQEGDADETPNPKKRHHKINNLKRFCGAGKHFGVSEADIRNPLKTVDVRASVPPLDMVNLLFDKRTNKPKAIKKKVQT